MRNRENWAPTKFEQHGGRWRGSRDPNQVMVSSRLMADRIAAAYVRALENHARGDLLDLGCGHVPLYGSYRHLVKSVICADWPQTMHYSPHLDVEVDLNGHLPFDTASFDTVLLTDVLEHLPYPDKFWVELCRVLKPGGTAIVGVPFMYWLHEQPHDHHRYTEHRLRLFCQDHGFDVLECSPYGGPTDVAADVLGKLLYHSGVLKWVARPVMWFGELIGRRRIDMTSPLPLGYLLVARRTVKSHLVEPIQNQPSPAREL
jgi:SAM-dependent methyltransferase